MKLRAVYSKIKKGHLLSPARMRVYEDLYKFGPSTVGEINKRLSTARTANPSFHRRLSEMAELGVVGRRRGGRCPISGRKADVWYITGKMPVSDTVPRYPNGILKETLYLGLEEIFFLIHRFRRINPEYSAPKHLTDLCLWLGRRGMSLSRRDMVARAVR